MGYYEKKIFIVIQIYIVLLFVIISNPVWENSSHTLNPNQDNILAYEDGLKLYYLNNFVNAKRIGLNKEKNKADLIIYNMSNEI